MEIAPPSNERPFKPGHPVTGIQAKGDGSTLAGVNGGEVASTIARETARERHLHAIATGDSKAVVIVIGLPAAGKTTLMKALSEQLKFEPADRLIPRPRRADDLPSEHVWTAADQADPAQWKKVLFAHQPFTGWYGFPKHEFKLKLRSDGCEGIFLQVGHPIDVPPLLDAVRNLFPLLPVATVRVYAPLEFVQARLSSRTTSTPEEIALRMAKLAALQASDHAQMPFLAPTLGVKNLLNLSANEVIAQGFDPREVPPLTEGDRLPRLIRSAIDDARNTSASVAKDILTPRKLTYDNPYIDAAMVDVIENSIVPACNASRFTPCIFAGLGAVLYGSPRAVSMDIDFEVPTTSIGEERVKEVFLKMTGKDVPVLPFEWDIAPCFGGRGMVRSELSGGVDVAIDANLIPRFRGAPNGFCYEFPFDAHDYFHRRTIDLPNGGTIGLVPPERILIHKLVMGRGYDVKKFDLLDAAAILANVPLEFGLIHKNIQIQHYVNRRGDVSIDPNSLYKGATALLESSSHDSFLIEAGLTNSEIRAAFSKWIKTLATDKRFEPMSLNERGQLLATTLKQAAMASRMIQSIDRIVNERNDPVQVGDGNYITFAKAFDEAALLKNAEWMKKLLLFVGIHEIGQWNFTHHVSRGPWTEGTPGTTV